MTTAEIIRLVLQGTVFLIWAALLFNVAFTLRRRVTAQTGQMFPGPLSALGAVRHWLRAPEDRTTRSALGLLTFVLVGMTLSHLFLSGL